MDYKVCKIYQPEAERVMKHLRIADCMNLEDLQEDCQRKENDIPYNLKELAVSDVLTCSYCNVSFTDTLDQRNHYKLDWHRYNLKRALCGNKPVPEEVFDSLGGDVSSISGSESESSLEDSDVEANELKMKKQTEGFNHRMKTIRHTKVFFENSENKILSVYKCLLQGKKESLTNDELVNGICELMKKPKQWMIVILGGGHFATAIFNNDTITHHKTFHFYTVRAKQGGSQSARDNKGGSHPKGAGASLRRHNEQTLVQHIQEVIAAWSEPIKQCSLILYRATGPYNRNVLFGGKNPPLLKTDHRLRNIPFPTRRATFNEVKRIHETLSTIEIYGSAECFRNKFPRSPDKRTRSPKGKKEITSNESKELKESPKDKSTSHVKPEVKARKSPQREMPGEAIKSASESSLEEEEEFELVPTDVTVSFQNLQQYEDDFAECLKQFRKNYNQPKKIKKSSKRKRVDVKKKKWNEKFEKLRQNLITSCENENKELLMESLNIYDTLPERSSMTSEESEVTGNTFTKEDFIVCLNSNTNDENRNTLLHLASQKGLPEFVTLLLSAGADPTIKNKNKLTPYVVSGNKETRTSFRSFAISFPDKYDFKKANIPEPLSKDEQREQEEKKKEKKKVKRMKEKIRKQEEKEKKIEEIDKERFLALSDREKCALAAERRLVASATANLKSAKPPVLSRCFQCGLDITGKIPYEYGVNRFCSIPCLKVHRAKTNSYGVEI